jgi:hypothetical protein
VRDFVRFDLPRGADPGRLRDALAAHFKRERLGHVRRAVLILAAVVALPLWIEVGWPGRLARGLVGAGFALFAVLGLVLVGVCVREYTWSRRSEPERERRDQEP